MAHKGNTLATPHEYRRVVNAPEEARVGDRQSPAVEYDPVSRRDDWNSLSVVVLIALGSVSNGGFTPQFLLALAGFLESLL